MPGCTFSPLLVSPSPQEDRGRGMVVLSSPSPLVLRDPFSCSSYPVPENHERLGTRKMFLQLSLSPDPPFSLYDPRPTCNSFFCECRCTHPSLSFLSGLITEAIVFRGAGHSGGTSYHLPSPLPLVCLPKRGCSSRNK